MISSKKINVITAVFLCIALFISGFMIFYPNEKTEKTFLKNNEPEYVEKVFGKDIIDIKIIADQDKWDNMLQNADSEEYTMADIIINGEKISDVGIRVKGNSSLKQVKSTSSALRYSFRIKFNKYIKKQKFYGLDSICLNNILADNTYMKEYISFDIMKQIGVDCPLTGYANISVNDKAWGFYLAVEAYNDSFLDRAYGDSSGKLYNVKNSWFNRNDKIGNSSGNNAGTGNAGMGPANNAGAPGAGINGNKQGVPGPRGMESASLGGSDLVYTDDDPDSYYNIFDNVIGKNSKKSDYKRVIKALKKLSEGKDLEKYFDVDQILKYLAAHTVVVNLDSYSSNMCQNYVLYEKNGRVTILPWDYGLAFGGMNSSNASEVVNFPIDTPVSGVALSDRPLIEKLFENKEYLERYHKYIRKILEDYFCNGKFNAKINQIDSLIRENVKNDVSKFITYEEYTKAVEAFKVLGNLRAQSIEGQLNGTVPGTMDGQKNNPDKLISAGDLKLSELGTMGGKEGERGFEADMISKAAEKAPKREAKDSRGVRQDPQTIEAKKDTADVNKKGILIISGLFGLSMAAVFIVSKIKRRY